MDTVQDRNRAVLDAVRIRRDDLYEAVLGLERALGVPAADAPEAWASLLVNPVGHLAEVLEEHVHGTEGEDGLFEQLREDAPRLLPAVERLRGAHDGLRASTDRLRDHLAVLRSASDVDDVRDEALDLMRALLEHRHRGAELLYEAYQVDVSAAD
jgi:hypothetical protein